MFKRKLIGIAVTFACMGTYVPNVYAAEEQAEEDNEFEKIVVTSQKRVQRLLDVPVSVQAISDEDLDNFGVLDFSDLVNISPSLSIQNNLSPWQNSIYIRGVGTTINSATVESSVSTVLDGVVLAKQGQFFSELADTERVEVLRGPQSTLFGKNASAGVVSIVTKKPNLDESEANIGIGLDEYGAQRIKGFYGAPMSDNWAYRVSANYSDTGESHLENVNINGNSFDNAKSHLVRAKLLWEASDNVEVLFIADSSASKSPGGARIPRSGSEGSLEAIQINGTKTIIASDDNRMTNINADNTNESDEYGVSAEINWDLGNMSFVSITAYRDWNITDNIDIDSKGFTTPLISMPGVGVPFFEGQVDGDRSNSQLSQEFRLQSSGVGDLQYVVGAYFWSTAYDSTRSEVRNACFGGLIYPVGTSCDGLAPVVIDTPAGPWMEPLLITQSGKETATVDTEYYALFGQLDYSLNDNTIVTAGIRVQKDELSWSNTQLGTVAPSHIPMPSYEGKGSVSNTETTGKLGIQHSFNRNANMYASYSRGYKGPGAELTSNFKAPLEPETVNAFEIGFKQFLLDNNLSLNIALFRQEFNDTQVSYFDVDEVAFLATNAGKTRQQGVELDAIFVATDNLTLTANMTYLDAQFLDYRTLCFMGDSNAECAIDGTKDVAGEVTPFAPKLKGILGARYAKDLSIGNLEGFVQLNYRWQSETQYDANQNPLTLQDAYGVADLSVGVAEMLGQYKVTLYVKNLADQTYASNLAAFQDAVGTEESVIQFVPKAADRYFGVKFEYNF